MRFSLVRGFGVLLIAILMSVGSRAEVGAGAPLPPPSLPPRVTPGIPFQVRTHLYVADGGNNRIVLINDMTGAGWTTLGTRGSGINQFSLPHAAFANPGLAGPVYVADRFNNRIVRINDMSGTGWTAFGSFGSGRNQFSAPRSISVDRAGRVYVADQLNHRIVRINDMTGAGWTTLGSLGSQPNQFDCPTDISVDSVGRIYVADWGNGRVVRINDMTGAGWTEFGGFARAPDPRGLACGKMRIFVDPTGRIFVVDHRNNRLVRVNDMTGAGWTTFGSAGTGTGQFQLPDGIFVDGAGRIYVADSGNHRIVRIDDMSGTGWTTFASLGTGVNQFNAPQGLSMGTSVYYVR